MDDKCQVKRLLREGIFINTGDYILFAGSSYSVFGEDWEYGSFDSSIVFDFNAYYLEPYSMDRDFDIPSFYNHLLVEDIDLFEGVSSGSTVIEANLTFNNFTVKDYYFDVYVDQQPCLCAVCPRECISDCYDDEAYQFCN